MYEIILHQNMHSAGTEYDEVFVNSTASSLLGFDSSQNPTCITLDKTVGGIELTAGNVLQVNFNYLPECSDAHLTEDTLIISDNGVLKKISVANLMKEASLVLRSTVPILGSTELGDGNFYITENFVYFYTGTVWKRSSIAGE